MNRTLSLLTIAASAIALTGCVSVAGAVPVTSSTPPGDTRNEKCLTPTEGVISDLQDDITAALGDVTFEGHGVIKSDSGDDFWFIAVRFDEDGASRTGTWGTMQDPTTNEHIAYVAVDDVAPLVSTYKQPVEFAGTTSALVGADDCIPD